MEIAFNFCLVCGEKKVEKKYCPDCGNSYKHMLKTISESFLIPEVPAKSIKKNKDVSDEETEAPSKLGAIKNKKKRTEDEKCVKIKVDVLRNNISIKEKDGGGPRYIFIDRICTIKEIYEKIVQTYFAQGTCLGYKQDYFIKLLNSNKHRIDIEGTIKIDEYIRNNGIKLSNKLFYIEIEKLNGKNLQAYFTTVKKSEKPTRFEDEDSTSVELDNSSTKRSHEEFEVESKSNSEEDETKDGNNHKVKMQRKSESVNEA